MFCLPWIKTNWQLMTNLELVLSRLPGHFARGSEFQAKCPAHDDKRASLSVRLGDNGWVMLHCHAGCERDTILERLELRLFDIGPPIAPSVKSHSVVATYDYCDENGEVLYQVQRLFPKTFRGRKSDGNGGWIYNLRGVRMVLYRTPEIEELKRRLDIAGNSE